VVKIIDIEYFEFNRVKTAVTSLCTNCGTTDQTGTPKFPYLKFDQKDNPAYKPSIDSGSKENHVQPMIQIDVYMNNSDKYKAKQIMALADTQMQIDGFERIFGPQGLPTTTAGVICLTARYQAIIKQNAPNDFTVI
jgi:hypothetical protein